MDLSYAQNLEDYHLARAFEGQADGFYIDVGAGHPVADNVSCWFYLRGWHGIVVEPQDDLARLYAHMRPRDRVEACALGASVGHVAFHAVERLHGFSTTVAEAAERAQSFGAGHVTRQVPMCTLAEICQRNEVSRIDFLKVDVEGAEADVLAGGDWEKWRPRVVLLEALQPGTLADAWHDWEPYLLARGYDFVLFDGLNRFYVDRSDAALVARFPRQKADWLVVPHLGHTNRAPVRDDHPDHGIAVELVSAFLAELPRLDRRVVLDLLLRGMDAETQMRAPREQDRREAMARIFPRQDLLAESVVRDTSAAMTIRDLYALLIDTDAFRILTGRIAASYDGGQILD